MCCGPFDFSYPTYGGFFQRADRDWGRVGSVYSDPNYVPNGPSSDSNLESIDDSGFYGLPTDESFGEPDSGNQGELPDPKPDGGASPVPDDSTTSAEERKIWPVTFSNKNWR